MSNYQDMIFSNKKCQLNYLNENVANENPYKNNLNSYFFNRGKSTNKPKLNLKNFETPLNNRPSFLLEKLTTADTTNNINKKKELKLKDSSFIRNPSDKNIINLHKKYNQRNSSKDKYKEKVSKSLDICRPKLTIKKTRPSFYLPKLINIPSPLKDQNLYSKSSLYKDNNILNKEIDNDPHNNNLYKNVYLNSDGNVIDKNRSIEPIFIEKRIKYYNLKKVRFNFRNPIERNKVMKYIVNFNKILAINKC